MYTKNTWQSGDIITKAKLDNIEDGIYANSKLLVFNYIDDGNGSITPETPLDSMWGMFADAEGNQIAKGALAYIFKYVDEDDVDYITLILSGIDANEGGFVFRGLAPDPSDGDVKIITLSHVYHPSYEPDGKVTVSYEAPWGIS